MSRNPIRSTDLDESSTRTGDRRGEGRSGGKAGGSRAVGIADYARPGAIQSGGVSFGEWDLNCSACRWANSPFIASSSAFPSSSQANPTLTIVAFAVRVASYLAENLQSL